MHIVLGVLTGESDPLRHSNAKFFKRMRMISKVAILKYTLVRCHLIPLSPADLRHQRSLQMVRALIHHIVLKTSPKPSMPPIDRLSLLLNRTSPIILHLHLKNPPIWGTKLLLP